MTWSLCKLRRYDLDQPVDMTVGKMFDAGMSGGVAHVYNPLGYQLGLCNEDVTGDLEPLQAEEVSL